MSDEEEKLKRKMKEFDCQKCEWRTDAPPHPTNRGTACLIGFKQNPRTIQAARNLVANGGSLCFEHPVKYGG